MKGLCVVFLVLMMVCGCAAPSSVEDFRKVSERDSLGRFSYVLDMSDSLASYDVSFYARLDCGEEEFASLTDIPVDVRWKSPEGMEYVESLSVSKDAFVRKGDFAYDFHIMYRSGLVPVEHGEWELSLNLPDVCGLRGVGAVLHRNSF